jgi:hypothetical protein
MLLVLDGIRLLMLMPAATCGAVADDVVVVVGTCVGL